MGRRAAPVSGPVPGVHGVRMHAATAPRPGPASTLGVEWHRSWAPREADDCARVRELPALHRLLLTMDGTVTTALATIVDEAVGVRTLAQHSVTIDRDDEELVLWAGGKVLDRRVLLHGAGSGAPLLYGASRIVAHRLPRAARDALVGGTIAIGLVLRTHEIETFRVPLSVGIRPASEEAAAHLGPGLMCWRTYAINAGGRPLMIVHEEFPAAGFGAQR
jgi:chorismate-pyruvate lyase